MLELSALGLLQREPLHGYRLKQQLELFMGSCLSVNYGAIYPLLKRLQQRGYIEVMVEEAGDAGSCRRIYRITPQGRDRWRYKMLEHPQESWVKSRSRFLIKFFFFSDLEPSARLELLQTRLAVCYQRQAYLNQEETVNHPTDPYQAVVWHQAKAMLKFEIDWLHQVLESCTSESSHLRTE